MKRSINHWCELSTQNMTNIINCSCARYSDISTITHSCKISSNYRYRKNPQKYQDIIFFQYRTPLRCCLHPFYVKISQIMYRECRKVSYSRLKKRVESIASRGRDAVSRALSTSTIQDGVKHEQMRFIHNHSKPPPDTVLRRAPRSLGSALGTLIDI